jgi:tetratricopeptide (TPR) repeat protein
VRRALVIVICLVAAACSASGPGPRPLERGFTTGAGVADPYEDGKRQLAAGRYEVAVERFAQALASHRHSLDALNGLGIAYTRLGRFDVAQTYFERALQVDATNVSTLNNYGWSLIEQGRLRDAKPFLELALRHAEQAHVPVVAGNIDSIRRARPSALAGALESDSGPGALLGPHRLMRVDDNAYRLETTAAPAGRPEPATGAHAASSPERSLRQLDSAAVPPPRADAESAASVRPEGVGGAGVAPASAEHFRAAELERDLPVNTPSAGGPIQLWPKPQSESEAGPILAGD